MDVALRFTTTFKSEHERQELLPRFAPFCRVSYLMTGIEKMDHQDVLLKVGSSSSCWISSGSTGACSYKP